MSRFLENYRISLIPITPVFIGSGKSYCKNEYVFVKEKNILLFPELHKLFHEILKNNLVDEYKKFIENSDNKDLYQWLQDWNIDVSESAPWVKYKLNLTQEESENLSLMEIESCVKNAYGEPYIPGSSLKGAIRTAIISYLVSNSNWEMNYQLRRKMDNIKQAKYGKCKKYVFALNPRHEDSESTKLQQRIFLKLKRNKKKWKNAVNDYMSAISISDSAPLSVSELVLCQKVDAFENGSVNKINVLRESIYTKSPIVFTMTINKQLAGKLSYLNEGLIKKGLESLHKNVNDCFDKYFGYANTDGSFLYLGGGTGFVTKTIVYPLLGQEDGRNITSKILYSRFPKESKHDTCDKKVAPHTIKCTELSSGELCPMGRCKIKIEKI